MKIFSADSGEQHFSLRKRLTKAQDTMTLFSPIYLYMLLILALSIWEIQKIIMSRADALSQIVWVAIIGLLPLLGLLAWYVKGSKLEQFRKPRQ